MPLHIPDPIFKGTTAVSALRILPKIIPSLVGIERYVIPCVGQFTIPEAMVQFGVIPGQIETSDITLFTSVLGTVVSDELDIESLGFAITSEKLQQITESFHPQGKIEQAAEILYVIKWGQLSGKNDFLRWQKESFEYEKEPIYKQYIKTLENLRAKMLGAAYHVRDAFEHVDSALTDEHALIWFNPPGYKGGYSKMFDGKDNYKWAAPSIPELDPAAVPAYLETLTQAPAHVLLYATEGHALPAIPDDWHVLYTSMNEKTRRKSYVLSNKPMDTSVVLRSKITYPPNSKWAVFDDREITENSVVTMVPCKKEEALYFYDLFVRELGMVKAEVYYLFCVDGMVAGACGFFMHDWRLKRSPFVFETFGISLTSQRYARLGRLLMTAITCTEFRDQLVHDIVVEDSFRTKLVGLRTTCLTKYPEAKKNRGILKLVFRERMSNGRFHLVYETEWHQKTYKQVVVDWFKKHASFVRIEGKSEE